MCVYKNKKTNKTTKITQFDDRNEYMFDLCAAVWLFFSLLGGFEFGSNGRKIAFTSADTFVNGRQSYGEHVYAPKTHFHFHLILIKHFDR